MRSALAESTRWLRELAVAALAGRTTYAEALGIGVPDAALAGRGRT